MRQSDTFLIGTLAHCNTFGEFLDFESVLPHPAIWQWDPTTTCYPNTYFLRIGPNVDIAFISICAYALDELFSDDSTAHHHHDSRW